MRLILTNIVTCVGRRQCLTQNGCSNPPPTTTRVFKQENVQSIFLTTVSAWLIGCTLAFGSRGPDFKSQWRDKFSNSPPPRFFTTRFVFLHFFPLFVTEKDGKHVNMPKKLILLVQIHNILPLKCQIRLGLGFFSQKLPQKNETSHQGKVVQGRRIFKIINFSVSNIL